MPAIDAAVKTLNTTTNKGADKILVVVLKYRAFCPQIENDTARTTAAARPNQPRLSRTIAKQNHAVPQESSNRMLRPARRTIAANGAGALLLSDLDDRCGPHLPVFVAGDEAGCAMQTMGRIANVEARPT